jgi:hypothetical protein
VTFNQAGGITLTLEQLGVIKTYSGMDVLRIGDGEWWENGRIQTTGALYQQAWETLYSNLLVKFSVANGLLDGILPGITYDADTDLLSFDL